LVDKLRLVKAESALRKFIKPDGQKDQNSPILRKDSLFGWKTRYNGATFRIFVNINSQKKAPCEAFFRRGAI
jgi:hypothetical protein